MAMRKEPDRRYPSVEALVDDLNRHLLGKPVLARQGDWRYNTAKFMRRHLLAVFIVSAAFLGLAVIAGVTLWQNYRIELALDVAAQERDRAQLVSAFLVDVFSQADPFTALGQTVSAKDLLDRGAERITSNVTLQPEVRAELLESIGGAYRHQGLPDRAIPLFEQAVAIRRAERPLDNHRMAAALANLAQALNDGGHMVSAEADLQQALDVAHRADGSSPTVQTADILVQFGQFELNGKSEPERASKLFDEALGIYRSALGNQHVSVAAALSGLADAAVWVNDYAAAERYQRQAIEILQATVSRNYPDYAVGLANLGYILTQRGAYAEAERLLNEAQKIDNEVFGEDSDRSAQVQKHLSLLYDRQDDEARATEAMKKAIAISTKRHGADHYMTGYYRDALASLYLKANDLRSAEEASRSSLAVFSRALPSQQHLYVASARWTLGEILLRRGLPADAEAEFRASADINTALTGADSWRTARSTASLGWALIKDGKVAEGEPILVAARARLLATVGPHDVATQEATARLVDYYRSRHRDAEAEQVLRGANKR
jgi:tetratricopeptide (TPR) repeat protein